MRPQPTAGKTGDTVGLDTILRDISGEVTRLAEQCGNIQWSISTMLETLDHPDLGAEIHMLQDIDRIQQTLTDVARLMSVARAHASGPVIARSDAGAAIRLESLRRRLGLSADPAGEAGVAGASEITWL